MFKPTLSHTAAAIYLPFLLSSNVLCQTAPKHDFDHQRIRHVLLISIDGMHGVDLLTCSQGVSNYNDGAPFCPNLAALAGSGVTYTDAYTSKPSDSFPGLTGIVTGGTPRSTGIWYDVAYDRSLDPPAKTTGNGVASGKCTANAAPTGTRTEYEEGIDIDQSKLNGGAPGASLTDGGITAIDPARLPRDPSRGCAPVYPWDFVRTNSIFSVIHAAGGFTAWSDKHAAYSSVGGHGGAHVLNDFYSPEINSSVVALPGVVTPTGLSCSAVPDPGQLGSWTDSFMNIQCYDTLKVNAIVNEINGKTHDGKPSKVPNIFGLNFQALSVAQKLIENGTKGGYLDGAATPSEKVLNAMQFVDASVGLFMAELRKEELLDSTLIVITAKHGQSPIDPARFFPIPGHSGANGTTPADLVSKLLPYSESPDNPTGIGPTQDDISLLWLADANQTENAVNLIEKEGARAGLGQIFYGATLQQLYDTPGLLPYGDPRTPDIIVAPNYGVIYTGSTKKQEEHGGFSHDDTNVVLLISNPAISTRTISAHVEVTQVAPTVLQQLGLSPASLDAVRLEGTAVLPGIQFEPYY